MHELSDSWILRVVGKQKGYMWSLLFELYTHVKWGFILSEVVTGDMKCVWSQFMCFFILPPKVILS